MSRRLGILTLAGALFLVTGDARAQAPAGMEETGVGPEKSCLSQQEK